MQQIHILFLELQNICVPGSHRSLTILEIFPIFIIVLLTVFKHKFYLMCYVMSTRNTSLILNFSFCLYNCGLEFNFTPVLSSYLFRNYKKAKRFVYVYLNKCL